MNTSGSNRKPPFPRHSTTHRKEADSNENESMNREPLYQHYMHSLVTNEVEQSNSMG